MCVSHHRHKNEVFSVCCVRKSAIYCLLGVFVISRIRKTVAVCKFMKGVIMILVDEIPSERNFPPSDTNSRNNFTLQFRTNLNE